MSAVTTSHQIIFEAIGTHWEIDIYDAIAPSKLKRITSVIKNRIAEFDKTYSRFRDDSTIMQLAYKIDTFELPKDAEPLFRLYESLYKITEGKMTPLVGDLLVQAGYDASYSLAPSETLLPAMKWEETIRFDPPHITNSQKVILDVGAAGKGYIVDIVDELLQDAAMNNYLIDAGGDMLHRNSEGKTARIGLEHPNDSSLAIGVVNLGNESICGSASNRRKWASLHHIMNPLSAEPAQEVLATWTVADKAIIADGLATALFSTSAEILRQHYRFEYVLVRSDMSIEYSKGLKAEIFGDNN